jgi:hypothetical protein
MIYLYEPGLWCDHSGGTVAMYIIEIAHVALCSGAVWRCLDIICKFEAQRQRLALKLLEEGIETHLERSCYQRWLGFLSSWGLGVLLAVFCVLIVPLRASGAYVLSYTAECAPDVQRLWPVYLQYVHLPPLPLPCFF